MYDVLAFISTMVTESQCCETERCVRLSFITDSGNCDFFSYYMNCRESFIAVNAFRFFFSHIKCYVKLHFSKSTYEVRIKKLPVYAAVLSQNV